MRKNFVDKEYLTEKPRTFGLTRGQWVAAAGLTALISTGVPDCGPIPLPAPGFSEAQPGTLQHTTSRTLTEGGSTLRTEHPVTGVVFESKFAQRALSSGSSR